jgi:hypothetical protein
MAACDETRPSGDVRALSSSLGPCRWVAAPVDRSRAQSHAHVQSAPVGRDDCGEATPTSTVTAAQAGGGGPTAEADGRPARRRARWMTSGGKRASPGSGKRSSGPRISRAALTSSSRTIKSIVPISGRIGCGPPLIAATLPMRSWLILREICREWSDNNELGIHTFTVAGRQFPRCSKRDSQRRLPSLGVTRSV